MVRSLCPDCGKFFGESGKKQVMLMTCSICNAKRKDDLERRQALPVGGQSCPESYEAYLYTLPEAAARTGVTQAVLMRLEHLTMRDCGGGRRVIRKEFGKY